MEEVKKDISAKTQATVLKILQDSPGRFFPYNELSSISGLEKGIIKHAILQLQESGIDITIEDTKGCQLNNIPDIILPAILHAGLKCRIMGANIHSFKSIGSTNEVAKRMAEADFPEGTLVISEKQTKGRGRLGRTWHSPSGKGLYFSIILRPKLTFERLPALPLVAGLAVCRAIDGFTGLTASLKWPNDCLINGKKVAGILVELTAELDQVSYAVMGVGINVNTAKSDFPTNLRSKATSLAIEKGIHIDRAAFLRKMLFEFEKSYHNFVRYGLRFIGPELAKRSAILGKEVEVKIGSKKTIGVVTGIDQNGALRLNTKNGIQIISAGEVTLRK